MGVETPILDKIKKVNPEARVIQNFLEWLEQDTGYVIAKYYQHPSSRHPCPTCGPYSGSPLPVNSSCIRCRDVGQIEVEGASYIGLAGISKRQLVYKFFDIDEQAEDRERVAILEEMRAAKNA